MTREEFKARWESDEDGGGISFEDIAHCAKAWGLYPHPKTADMFTVRYRVLLAAGTVDAEEFNPANEEDETDAA